MCFGPVLFHHKWSNLLSTILHSKTELVKHFSSALYSSKFFTAPDLALLLQGTTRSAARPRSLIPSAGKRALMKMLMIIMIMMLMKLIAMMINHCIDDGV